MTACNNDPNAQHGFDRNASHNAGRYVCECEGQAEATDPVETNKGGFPVKNASYWKRQHDQAYAAGKREAAEHILEMWRLSNRIFAERLENYVEHLK